MAQQHCLTTNSSVSHYLPGTQQGVATGHLTSAHGGEFCVGRTWSDHRRANWQLFALFCFFVAWVVSHSQHPSKKQSLHGRECVCRSCTDVDALIFINPWKCTAVNVLTTRVAARRGSHTCCCCCCFVYVRVALLTRVCLTV